MLYINAGRLQSFQRMLENSTVVSSADVYAKLARENENIYSEIKHVIRKEIFSYLPPFKAALMSLGILIQFMRKLQFQQKLKGLRLYSNRCRYGF